MSNPPPNQGPPPDQQPQWPPPAGDYLQRPPPPGPHYAAPSPDWTQPQPATHPWARVGGYGQPPPSGGNKLVLLVAGAGALLLAVVVVLVLVFARGGSSSPKSTVESFIDAAQRQDCDEAYGHLTESFQEETGPCSDPESKEDLIIPDENITFTDIRLQDESGSEATVTTTLSAGGEEFPVEFALVKEDGDWKIDSIE